MKIKFGTVTHYMIDLNKKYPKNTKQTNVIETYPIAMIVKITG